MLVSEKDTPTQVFFCEICKNFENTYFHRTSPVAASEVYKDFVDISCENTSFYILRDYMAIAYLFLN